MPLLQPVCRTLEGSVWGLQAGLVVMPHALSSALGCADMLLPLKQRAGIDATGR